MFQNNIFNIKFYINNLTTTAIFTYACLFENNEYAKLNKSCAEKWNLLHIVSC